MRELIEIPPWHSTSLLFSGLFTGETMDVCICCGTAINTHKFYFCCKTCWSKWGSLAGDKGSWLNWLILDTKRERYGEGIYRTKTVPLGDDEILIEDGVARLIKSYEEN